MFGYYVFKELGKTYNQRYYVNAEFWFNNQSPVFLFIGGEGTLTSRDVEAGNGLWDVAYV